MDVWEGLRVVAEDARPELFNEAEFEQLRSTLSFEREFYHRDCFKAELVEEFYHVGRGVDEGCAIPDALLYTLDSKSVQLSSTLARDRPTVLNFGSYS